MPRGRDCDSCGGSSSRAARYCQWCGEALRETEPFESDDLAKSEM